MLGVGHLMVLQKGWEVCTSSLPTSGLQFRCICNIWVCVKPQCNEMVRHQGIGWLMLLFALHRAASYMCTTSSASYVHYIEPPPRLQFVPRPSTLPDPRSSPHFYFEASPTRLRFSWVRTLRTSFYLGGEGNGLGYATIMTIIKTRL